MFMHKNVFKSTFYLTVASILPINFVNTSIDTMVVKVLNEQTDADSPKQVQLTFPKFSGTQLACEAIEKISNNLKEKHGENVQIDFFLPDTVKYIGKKAFCSMQENLVSFCVSNQNNVEEIRKLAFSECEKFNIVKIDDQENTGGVFPHLKVVDHQAFRLCKKLTVPIFNRNTPVVRVGGNVFAKSGITRLEIPRSVNKWISSFGTVEFEEVFIPKEAPLICLVTEKQPWFALRIYIDPEIKADNLLKQIEIINKKFYSNYFKMIVNQTSILGFRNEEKICSITIGDPSNKEAKNNTERDSVLLFKNFHAKLSNKTISKKIVTSSDEKLKKLMEESYRTFLNDNSYDNNTVNNAEPREFLMQLPPELILFALSQDAGEFLKNFEEENPSLYLLFLRTFLFIRFYLNMPCDDLCQACEDQVDLSFIKDYFLREEATFSYKMTPENMRQDFIAQSVFDYFQNDFINIFKSDNVDTFIKWANTITKQGERGLIGEIQFTNDRSEIQHSPTVLKYKEFPIRSKKKDYKIYPKGNIKESVNFNSKVPPSFLDLAALYGSIKIFKYILLNNGKISDSTLAYACWGGEPEIIHIVKQNLKTKKISIPQHKIKQLLIFLPYPDICRYIRQEYLPQKQESDALDDETVSAE